MKFQNLFLLISAGLIISAPVTFAQQMSGGMNGGMMAGTQDAKMAMMQEPNKAMAQASVLYMTDFTKSLHIQSSERRDKIDSHFIKATFAEMKRAHSMIESFQAAHVKTMDAEMRENVKMMMMKMNTNLADIHKHLEALEKEVNGKQNLDIISDHCQSILKNLGDIPKPKQSGMEMPTAKPMMQ
jgi:ribosomal protein S15P/S13E